jgi:hypothetical protein
MSKWRKCGPVLVAAALIGACGDSGGPDFERELGPGEYQVSVTGDVQRSFETTGATFYDDQNLPGWGRTSVYMWDDTDALDGADFHLCAAPVQQATYVFDAVTEPPSCPPEPGHVTGGFIVQLGAAPQQDELDCYPNGYGDKDFEGVLTITSVTANEIEGEAQGDGTCSRHPHSEIEPMRSAAVSVRIRFRAMRGDPLTDLDRRQD